MSSTVVYDISDNMNDHKQTNLSQYASTLGYHTASLSDFDQRPIHLDLDSRSDSSSLLHHHQDNIHINSMSSPYSYHTTTEGELSSHTNSTTPSSSYSSSSSTSTSSLSSSSSSSSSPSPATSAPSQDKHELRFLITSAQVGSIIGKGGVNVKNVRDVSNCYVSILKTEWRDVLERIMVLKGTVQEITKAIEMIADLLILAMRERKEITDEETPSVAVRILVHRAIVGAIIGKSGSVIKDTQQFTQARIQVSNETLLNSTEKPVTITGTSVSIGKAIEKILTQLSEAQLRPHVKTYLYIPTPPLHQSQALFTHFNQINNNNNNSITNAAATYFAQPNNNSSPSSLPSILTDPHSLAAAAAATNLYHSPLLMPLFPSPTAPTIVTQKIAIPAICAGCIIGKGGNTIRDIRIQSGCNISISESGNISDNNNNNIVLNGMVGERIVSIVGHPGGIATAVYLIRQLIETYSGPILFQ